jgi:hypothetical protein
MDIVLFKPKTVIMSTFSKTQSIGVFAQMNGINKIDLVENPHTGKIFGVSDTGLTFRVSEKVDTLTRDLSISYFTPADGEPSWMIHPTGESNVQSTLAFTPISK